MAAIPSKFRLGAEAIQAKLASAIADSFVAVLAEDGEPDTTTEAPNWPLGAETFIAVIPRDVKEIDPDKRARTEYKRFQRGTIWIKFWIWDPNDSTRFATYDDKRRAVLNALEELAQAQGFHGTWGLDWEDASRLNTQTDRPPYAAGRIPAAIDFWE